MSLIMPSNAMHNCFIHTAPVVRRKLFSPQLPSCKRRYDYATSPQPRRPNIRMAKYEPKKTRAELPEEQRPLDEILPPPALPTLSTLTGDTIAEQAAQAQAEIEGNPQKAPAKVDYNKILQMGGGMSVSQENAALKFFAGVYDEFQVIEWPSFGRVIRLTIIVILTIVVATVSLYVVDGFFYRLSQAFFQDNM